MKRNKKISNAKTLSVIGLGRLGAPLAACFAAKGFQVIGVDRNPAVVSLMNTGKAPVYEPGLDELIRKNKKRIRAVSDIQEAVLNSQATFIVVATPSNESGASSLEYVLPVCKDIAEALRQKSEFHLVVLTSTVMPGAMQNEVLKVLEAHSGKKCGKDFGLCYNPEFIALGSVIHDFLNPDLLLIGESDSNSGSLLEALYKGVHENRPKVARMNWINAELVKLSLNTFITTKITFSNTLARICEKLPKADVDIVSSALGLDSRIGPKYLKGAIGYGGPCFPRDTVAFSQMAKSLGISARLAEATDETNREQVLLLKELIKLKLAPGGTVGILGLSYKPDTNVAEASQGLLLAQVLVQDGIEVVAYDPLAVDNAKLVLNGSVCFSDSPKQCITASDVIAIITPWKIFQELRPQWFKRAESKRVLIDCWRFLDPAKYQPVTEYIALGLGPDEFRTNLEYMVIDGANANGSFKFPKFR